MIEVIVTHQLIRVKTPYHPDFPALARAMEGDWDKTTKRWTFPADQEDNVREMLIDIFGTDSEDFEAVNVVYRLTHEEAQKAQVFALGRELARRRKFNQEVRLGKSVSIVEGVFPMKAGTPVKPRLGGSGAFLLVENVPKLIADKAKAAAPEHIHIR